MYDVLQPNQTLIAETCNVFRQLTDIYDSWGSVIGMIDYFGDDPQNISQVARPGAWNDPDQVTPLRSPTGYRRQPYFTQAHDRRAYRWITS